MIETATRAIRRRFGDGVEIGTVSELSGGSERSTVLRVQLTGADAPASTAVIKVHPEESTTWQNEAAAAAYLGRIGGGLTPDLLALDRDRRVLVLSDLGDHPQLSDALLGDDPAIAERAVLDWADGIGDLLARTFGGRDEFARVQAELELPPPTEFWADRMRRACSELPDLVRSRLNMRMPAEMADELESWLSLLDDRRFEVVSPSDLCPDNNLLTPMGVRFLDLEFAGCTSVFLEAAYARMPFPTCWVLSRRRRDCSMPRTPCAAG